MKSDLRDFVRRAAVTLLLIGWGLVSEGTVLRAAEGSPRQTRTDGENVREVADMIDGWIGNRWSADRIVPAPKADDAEFFRRIYLDIAGQIPPVAEVRAFLDSTAPDKRQRAVDALLDSPLYTVNFATVWRSVMMPEADTDQQVRVLLPGFETWLRSELSVNRPYDEMVFDILTTPLNAQDSAPGMMNRGTASPVAFYQAKQIKPENLAAATSRIFLGIRIECAQCHDHPFDAWKQRDFWSYAAFFAGLERSSQSGVLGGLRELFDKREIAIPDTDQVVTAAYLDGSLLETQALQPPRRTLAEWVVSSENPYFARTAVNRLWGHFFGRGLVDPVDDFGGGNDPSHPELLDALARAFVESGFDTKFMIRVLTSTRAYQLTSRLTDPSQELDQVFGRMAVKSLATEQLFASLTQATGVYQPFAIEAPFAVPGQTPVAEFRELFQNDAGSRTDRQTTILQSLLLMNGQFIGEATDLQRSQTLAAVVTSPFLDTRQRVDVLFLASLGRYPRADESTRIVTYVDQAEGARGAARALGDVFWALLNSSEFIFNH